MIDPDSRYARLAETPLRRTGPHGRTITYLPRRMLEPFAVFETLGEVPVGPGDRLDLISARTLGAADAWWRIADANTALDPRDLVEARADETTTTAQKRLRVPVPRV